MAANIPYEILLNILSKLPKKVLFASKLVSKAWSDMVDEPCLSSMHLTSIDSDYPDSISLIDHRKNGLSAALISTLSICDDLSLNTTLVTKVPVSLTSVSNSCNGLICFTFTDHENYDNIYVCNPLTKQTLFVQRAKNDPNIRRTNGLGFDPATNTYKIVRVTSGSDFTADGKVEVLALGTNSCRKIEAGPPELFEEQPVFTSSYGRTRACRVRELSPEFLDEPPVYADGALHWITPYRVSDRRGYVISFDMTKEVFQAKSHGFVKAHLAVLKGCLAVIDRSFDKFVDIWLLNEQRSEWFRKCESMRLYMRFDDHGGVPEDREGSNCNTAVLGMWGCDEILVKNKGKLCSYKMSTHQLRRVDTPVRVDFDGLKIVCFRRSIVSLHHLARRVNSSN